jgi:hypothetical protein
MVRVIDATHLDPNFWPKIPNAVTQGSMSALLARGPGAVNAVNAVNANPVKWFPPWELGCSLYLPEHPQNLPPPAASYHGCGNSDIAHRIGIVFLVDGCAVTCCTWPQ